jgi:TatD DNase family protein
MLDLCDTHCHIQFRDYPLPADEVIASALEDGVRRMLCVGCTLEDSQAAVELVSGRDGLWAAVGIHPHEAARYIGNADALKRFEALASKPKVVAVGEIGLDYYYTHSPKATQTTLLRFQLELGQKYGLPFIFHIRDAFDDFWPIFDEFPGVTGVVHSFTATKKELDEILKRGLYIGLNGIMTFSKQESQLEAAKAIPLDKLLLETDAPFLTPKPFRGTICQPKHVRVTAEFLSELRGESLKQLAAQTTQNTVSLFNL